MRPPCFFGRTQLLALTAAIFGCSDEPGPAQPAALTRLVFTVQPTNVAGAQRITPPVQVAIQDGSGNTLTTATDTVTLALSSSPGVGTLSGTLRVAAIQGIATFTDAWIDRPGSYTLAGRAPGFTGATSVPFAVTLSFTVVSASNRHSCGVTTTGAAYCWGDNFSGELGDGTTIPSLTPVLVGGGVRFTMVGAGSYHTCGLTAAGAVSCWGHNYYGLLGDGSTTDRASPVPVAGGLTFTALSVGYVHTCGVTGTGAAYCWGSDEWGKLGSGTRTVSRSSPTLVTGGLTFAAVSAGRYHTCGIATAGRLYCWGSDSNGEFGDGTTTAGGSTPVLAAGGQTFAAVSAGSLYTCGLRAAGAAYCWGDGFAGELGDGTMTNRLTPVLVAGGLTFTALSAGSEHTCGLTAVGAAYCWGWNIVGQLGVGTATGQETCTGIFPADCITMPVAVTGGLRFAAVSSGDSYTCGVTTAGAAYCWGRNEVGQIGDGTTTNPLAPVRVVQ